MLNIEEQPLEITPGDIFLFCAVSRNISSQGKGRKELKDNFANGVMGVLSPESVPDKISRWSIDEIFDTEEGEEWRTAYVDIRTCD